MTTIVDKIGAVTFAPKLMVDDPNGEYWLQQVSLRLRREVCWLWHERGLLPHQQQEGLPPCSDKASTSLSQTRNQQKKERFFHDDPTGHYLTNQIEHLSRPKTVPAFGSFGWVIDELLLSDTSAFTLGMALITTFDSSASSVVACCQNDTTKTIPTLALIQQLWNEPEEILRLGDDSNRLFRFGLLQKPADCNQSQAWEWPLRVSPLAGRRLLFPDSDLPEQLTFSPQSEIQPDQSGLALTTARIQSKPDTLKIIPVMGNRGCDFFSTVITIASQTGRKVATYQGRIYGASESGQLSDLATLCWLYGVDLFLPAGKAPHINEMIQHLPPLPISIYIGLEPGQKIADTASPYRLPPVSIPACSYLKRVAQWQRQLGEHAPSLRNTVTRCARQFRFEEATIANVCRVLRKLDKPISHSDLFQGCRDEIEFNMGELAQKVCPRFRQDQLVLPPRQTTQFREILTAMNALAEVHYDWGTATPWNECGLSVLFSGPPGTGKTMAAEVLAAELNLPMFRIDLSQVVNKYIGETEKNLRILFDNADLADVILFFDEADALFGKRTEVKDAHDRYANLEISYLLERMERFKGLAILATNRKKDLDTAFLRRLRYIIDFPVPDVPEREAIWQQVIPAGVNSSDLNVPFLAAQFNLTGGHIRSIVFNACLQSTNREYSGRKAPKQLKMAQVLIAVKREYEKMNKSLSLEKFGPYSNIIEELEKKYATHRH